MRGRQLRRAVLVAATAALGCLLAAQFIQLTQGVRVSQAAQAALVARVDWPPPDPQSGWPPPDPSAPWFPDPHPYWHGGWPGGGDGGWYGGGSGGWPGPGDGGWYGGGYGGWPGRGHRGGDGGWHWHRYQQWPGHGQRYQDPVPGVSLSPAPSVPVSPEASPVPSPAPSLAQSPAPAVGPAPAPAPTGAGAPGPAGFPAPGRIATDTAAPPVASFPIPIPADSDHSQHQSWPVTLTIRTLPALPHVQFSFDGRSLVTDASGEASYTEPHNFHQHTLTLLDTSIDTRLRHYHFTRWAGERDPEDAFRAAVNGLPMRADYTVTAAFTIQCRVRPRFTDQDGKALDPRHISRVTLKSSAGRQVNISATHPSWLDCVQPVYRDSALTSEDMKYAAQAVMFAKANIVYAGVERFSPREQARPTFVGYFHNLTITAHDALFGGRIGSYALVRMPNRAVRRVALGPGHAITLDHLPQGDYQIDVRAGGAIVSAGSFRLSRSKTVNLTAVSGPDLATVGGGLLLVGGGLPLLATTRRKRLLGHLRSGRPDRPTWWPW